MNYAWLFGVTFSVNLLIWACIHDWIEEAKHAAYQKGLVLGRSLTGELLDRLTREAGIDPATLPEKR